MNTTMNLEEQLKALKLYQTSGYMHPLTCGGKNCKSASLEPSIVNNEINLTCPVCSNVQKDFPKCILRFYEDNKDMDWRLLA